MTPRRVRRRGFTVVELIVVSMLTTILAVILSSIWRGLCIPALDASARCRIALEANPAAASLARDLGGSLADPAGRPGGANDGRYVGRVLTPPSTLRLCFHGGTSADMTPRWAAPDTVISYQLQGDQLIRTNEATGVAVTIASSLSALEIAPLPDGSGLDISMAFTVRDLSLSYHLVTVDPPAP
jgi:prepilin-type N-terminal cleavage/methylation domain-containing protein